MKLIEKLTCMIDEEIADAEKYAKCALKYKEERPALAKTFFDLSNEEMRHMTMLHGEVSNIIQRYKQERGDPPADMQAVYNYLHEKQVEKATAVKGLQAMYRDM